MTQFYTRKDYEQAATYIREKISISPKIGMILGSGLGPLADAIENPVVIPYGNIPGWPQSTVAGHAGQLVVGTLQNQDVLVMQGRVHFYEGHSIHTVTFPVRVMQMLGIRTLVVTNAAGGANASFKAGDIMLIIDQINIPGMAGQNPLFGPNDESLGPRFTILTSTYDKTLRELALKIAERENLKLQQGTYCFLSGPSFETPAEIRMLRTWGADAVGMSTVPETLVARNAGMRVLGFSSITNVSIDNVDSTQDVSHEEVLETGKTIVPRLITLLKGILSEMPEPD